MLWWELGETKGTRTEENLSDGMKTEFSGKFLKYMKAIPISLQLVNESENQLFITCHHMKISVPGVSYIKLSFCQREFHGNPPPPKKKKRKKRNTEDSDALGGITFYLGDVVVSDHINITSMWATVPLSCVCTPPLSRAYCTFHTKHLFTPA